MGYTLGQAARMPGRSKTMLNRAIKSGKLSAVGSEDGSDTIDPAELQRVYRLTGAANGHMVRSVTAVTVNGADDPEPALQQWLLAERDRLVEEQALAIRDLRERLDESETERRSVQTQLTALLTDQRPIAGLLNRRAACGAGSWPGADRRERALHLGRRWALRRKP